MIAVVGAGLTGLALAHELARREVEHVVFEAADRPGGVIRSRRVEGRLLEFGPQRGRMTSGLAALIADLGLEREALYAPEGLPLFVYAEGALREVAFDARSLLTGDLLSLPGKLRLLLEPLTAAPRDDERVATLLRRKLGSEAYERIAGPLYGGLYASDPADMVVGLSLAAILRELGVRRSLLLRLLRRGGAVSAPPACSFRDGMQALTDALHDAHAASIRLGTAVRGLSPARSGWNVELEDRAMRADTVVLTCDAGAAAGLVEGVAPETAARFRGLAYNPLAVVHLHATATGLRGLGYQVALGEDLATRGVTWNDSLFGREGVYTAFLGGGGKAGVVGEPDTRVGEIAASEFERVTGHRCRVVSVSRVRIPAWDLTWSALAGPIPPGIRIVANWQSRPGIPGRLSQAARVAQELSR